MASAKRFQFVISDVGSGHRSSAYAVREAMARLYGPAAQIELADIMVESELWPFRNFGRWYRPSVRLDSLPYGLGWHLTDHAGLVKFLSTLAWPYVRSSMERFLQRHPADVLVSFYPVMDYALTLAKHRLHLGTPMVSVVVDLVTVHASWFVSDADRFLVPTQEARQRALRCHVPPERIFVVGGMPVRREFVEAKELLKTEARARLGLVQDRPMVLVVGGGEGMGPLEAVVRAVTARSPRAQVAAIAGHNQALHHRLRQLELPQLLVEGFVPNLEVWMRAADLLVTKAGPNVLCEAFVCGLPMVLSSAVRGQETGNVTYVVENQAGVWAPRPEQAADAVKSLLADAGRREAMASRARSLARPEAADLLARHIWATGQRFSPT